MANARELAAILRAAAALIEQRGNAALASGRTMLNVANTVFGELRQQFPPALVDRAEVRLQQSVVPDDSRAYVWYMEDCVSPRAAASEFRKTADAIEGLPLQDPDPRA